MRIVHWGIDAGALFPRFISRSFCRLRISGERRVAVAAVKFG